MSLMKRAEPAGEGVPHSVPQIFRRGGIDPGYTLKQSKSLQMQLGYIRDRCGNNSNVFPSWSRGFDSLARSNSSFSERELENGLKKKGRKTV